ncbi:MAG: DUF1189 domain-containing protein [Gammaproteobacteria bacterium]|nr:DUF1189 domain-containing protein [Gammaproteobacteria bacterium]
MKSLSVDGKKTKRKTAHYRYLEACYMAFFSRRLYVDVVRRWHGYGLLYLLVMLSVFVLPYSVNLMIEYRHFVDQKIILPVNNLPPFSLRGGQVQFHSPMPYLVKNEQGKVISLIDTTGKIKRLPYFLYPDATVLVTKNELHVSVPALDVLKRGEGFETEDSVSTFSLDDNTNFVGADWVSSSNINKIKYLLLVSLHPVTMMFYFGMYIVMLFAFTLVGQFLTRFVFKVRLTFKEIARVMAVASTPQACLYFMLFAFNKVYSGTGIIYMVLLAIYFSFGVLAYRHENRAMVLQ